MAVQPSYLTCTAAQASAFNQAHPHEFLSLNQLLEGRAVSHPDICVAGFPELRDGRWESIELTFASLLAASNRVALHLLSTTTLLARTQGDISQRIVALLSPSCVDLLVTLFAALRLGYGVLLLAPQNMPDANSHLCRATGATHLICHAKLTRQGGIGRNGLANVDMIQMPERDIWHGKQFAEPLVAIGLSPEEEQHLPALVMHTSGSTGMPKPIYQPHRIWTQAIPCMPGRPAFTTTPLFHGGSADFLRSINALSTLYFSSSLYPVTVTNVVDAVSACPDVTAFLSVPYILKMLAEHRQGLEMLQRMELVSTGGAPLPPSLGDEMVQQGVNLVSRLGSSECGFLMSSHRDYDNDKQWSWLRNHNVSGALLRFEPVEDSEGMYELIVGKDWSTLVVSNRDDGSFASGDLYEKHPTICNAWRYAGRVDDMIVLTNGKKASANPIESALRACSEISEAVVFGASRPSLGVIVIPASTFVTRVAVLARVHAVNQTMPTYANVLDELVVVLSPDADLPKTSKGSVVRPRALQQYASVIEDAYHRLEEGIPGSAPQEAFENENQVKRYVKNAVVQIMEQHPRTANKLPLANDDDLFNAGVDSLQASAIQRVVQKMVGSGKPLRGNVVFEYPSIEKLSKHISSIIFNNQIPKDMDNDEEAYKEMRGLLERFSSPFVGVAARLAERPLTGSGVVVLTGATGSLGAHVLFKLLETTRYRVVALLRAQDDGDALNRVKVNMKRRKLRISGSNAARVTALASDLAKERLGLSQEIYNNLLEDVEIIFHVAWPVNFAYSLESFVPILQGTQNLITLAAHAATPARLVFCSSVAAASHSPDSSTSPSMIYETLPSSEACAAPLGYARAKWVAEHMCSAAQDSVLPAGRISVARVGQLCGDTVHGVWSEIEAWPLLVASIKYTGCLPESDISISLLPVDIAASALLDLVADSEDDIEDHSLITHITNPHPLPWSSFLSAHERAGLRFQRVPTHEWVARLEEQSENLDASTRNLVRMWRTKFGVERIEPEPVCDVTNARRVSASMRGVMPVSDELVERFVARWRESGFLRDEEVQRGIKIQ